MDFFHVDDSPLNYGTIQVNYRGAQRKSKTPYSDIPILRHGVVKLIRKVGGGLDTEYQKEVSEKKIMEHINKIYREADRSSNNIISLIRYKEKIKNI